MTMPTERYNSLAKTGDFLLELLDNPQHFTPDELSQQAYECLRHYPGKFYLSELAERCPDILEEPK